jgi:hypothetical protein
MQLQDFMLALTSNISGVSFVLALVASGLVIMCLVVLLSSGSEEFKEIELLGLIKTFLSFALIFWGLSSLPNTKDVKKIQQEFTPAKASVAKHVKVSKK